MPCEKKEQIGIWGDYDVDGTTGASVLVSFLREDRRAPIYHVPHRIEEGYGLNVEGLKRLSRSRRQTRRHRRLRHLQCQGSRRGQRLRPRSRRRRSSPAARRTAAGSGGDQSPSQGLCVSRQGHVRRWAGFLLSDRFARQVARSRLVQERRCAGYPPFSRHRHAWYHRRYGAAQGRQSDVDQARTRRAWPLRLGPVWWRSSELPELPMAMSAPGKWDFAWGRASMPPAGWTMALKSSNC